LVSAADAGLNANVAALSNRSAGGDMDGDSKQLATLLAHEKVLSFLLADFLRKMSPAQRKSLEQSLTEPANLYGTDALELDIGAADALAGFAMDHKESMQRLFAEALRVADAMNSRAAQ
jgi:uncharacterized protein YaaW (UPF0174 family)